jgi:hypothetical protein
MSDCFCGEVGWCDAVPTLKQNLLATGQNQLQLLVLLPLRPHPGGVSSPPDNKLATEINHSWFSSHGWILK